MDDSMLSNLIMAVAVMFAVCGVAGGGGWGGGAGGGGGSASGQLLQ